MSKSSFQNDASRSAGGREKTIGIVGPGRMGIGIATAVLMAGQGYEVTLFDIKERTPGSDWSALEKARDEISANLDLLAEFGLVDGDPAELLGRLTAARGLADHLGSCSLVFEALPETVEAKSLFYRQAFRFLPEEGVVASATSTFTLESFREMGGPDDRVVTAHWLNPAFLIPLVEVAYGEGTKPEMLARVVRFLEDVGKIPVSLRSSPGFIVPRIQVAAMNEAVRIVEEGLATPAQVDTAIKAGFGFRLAVLGLVEFIDLGGVDILAHAGEYLYGRLGQEQFKPPASVREKMASGETGPRAGRGYYEYRNVDTAALFRERYRGFADLLRHVATSPYLSFHGGIQERSGSDEQGGTQT